MSADLSPDSARPTTVVTDSPGRHRLIGLVVGGVVFAIMLAFDPPEGMSLPAWRVAAVGTLMAIWWLSEALPVAATALVPIVTLPVLSISRIGNVAAPYADPLIFLFLGGFMIALAMQRWGLHRRIALAIVLRAGTQPARLVGGFMLATASLSMWVSNTATAVMMLPIGISVIGLISANDERAPGSPVTGFPVAILLGIAYAASIGGLATLIGTPPNALLAAFLADRHGIEIGFAQWMLVGLPLSVIMLAVAWFLLTQVLFREQRAAIEGAGEAIRGELARLGPISPPERRVAAVFALTASCWITRPFLGDIVPGLTDTGIAVTAAVILFILPAGTGDGRRLLNWEWAKRLPWDVLLLFGGGLTLAAAINDSGLAKWIGAAMIGFSMWPTIAVIAAAAALVVFLTELTSNTATAATFLPLGSALAASAGMGAVELLAPIALAASCAFMMPVATPPNAIVFGSGLLTVPQMARAGWWLNVAAIAVITAAAPTILRWTFGP